MTFTSRTRPTFWRASAFLFAWIRTSRQDIGEVHRVGLVDVAAVLERTLWKVLLQELINHPPVDNLAGSIDEQDWVTFNDINQQSHAHWHVVDVADDRCWSAATGDPGEQLVIVVVLFPQKVSFGMSRFHNSYYAFQKFLMWIFQTLFILLSSEPLLVFFDGHVLVFLIQLRTVVHVFVVQKVVDFTTTFFVDDLGGERNFLLTFACVVAKNILDDRIFQQFNLDAPVLGALPYNIALFQSSNLFKLVSQLFASNSLRNTP